MTTQQYLAVLRRLKLMPSSKAAAAALGLTVRQCQNLAAGVAVPSATLTLLLRMYLRYGLLTEP